MKRLIPSTLFGNLVLAAAVATVLYALLFYFFFGLLIPREWGGATQ